MYCTLPKKNTKQTKKLDDLWKISRDVWQWSVVTFLQWSSHYLNWSHYLTAALKDQSGVFPATKPHVQAQNNSVVVYLPPPATELY